MSKRKSNISYLIAASSITLASAYCIDSEANIFKFNDTKNSIEKTTEKILEIRLLEGENIPEMVNNPDKYDKIIVYTEGNKKLDDIDFLRLNSSKIKNIDLSNSTADNIPANAFKSNTSIITFIFPNGVTQIGSNAFYGCNGLAGNLIIPESVVNIDSYAFYGCTKFTGNLVIPDAVTSIGEYAFYNCSGFDGSLTISNNISEIGRATFSNCTRFTGELIIPDNVKSIFSNTSSDSSNAFYRFGYTNGIDKLVVGKSIESELKIRCAFKDANIKFLQIAEGVTAIGDEAFYGSNGLKGNLIIPDTVTSIGTYAFYGCNGFTGNLVIPDVVTSIGEYAFYSCSGFDGALTIGNNVSEIGRAAFSNCTRFTGELTIPDSVKSIYSYTGSSSSYYSHNAFYRFGYTNGIDKLVVGKSIESELKIKSAFKDANIKFLEISDGVTTIGDEAFYGSNGLKGSLVIPESVTSIGNSAFYGCNGFTGNLVISDSITTIGEYAFYSCSGFDGTLTIGNNVSEIGRAVFSNCTGFTGDLIIPDNIKSIYSYTGGNSSYYYHNAFYRFGYTNGIDKLVVGKSIESELKIKSAFKDANIKFLEISDGVTTIGDEAFYGSNGLKGSLVIPESVTSIGNSAFRDCIGFTGELVIPDTVKTIGEYTFSGCNKFTGNLVIPNTITSLGKYAFYNCSGFDGTLTIGNGISNIPEGAFSNCIRFTGELTIPDNIKSTYSYTGSNNSYYSSNAFYRFGYTNGIDKLVVGKSIESELKIKSAFKDANIKFLEISDGVTTIGDEAFYGSNGLKGSLVIPESVTSIGNSAFRDCNGFTGELTIPHSIETIGEYTFSGCRGFTGNLSIPDTVISIGKYAFYNCSGFNGTLTIGNGISKIAEGAFSNCTGFTEELIIPDNIKSIYSYTGSVSSYYSSNAFYRFGYTNGIDKLVVGKSIESELKIKSAFKDANIKFLEISDGVTTIGDEAFYGSNGLKGSLVIPESVTSIGDYAFRDCTGFTGNLVIPESITSVGNYAFYGCNGFTGELTIPHSIETIGEYTFSGCRGFTGNLSIPDTVISIGKYAFYNCSGFNGTLTIGNGISKIAEGAFSNCTGFTGELIIPDNIKSIYSYTGSVSSYYSSNAFYRFGYTNGIDKLVVGKSIESELKIKSAFKDGKINSLEILDGVETIGSEAFYGANTIKGNLVIPESVTSIGNSAFRDCTGFTGDLIIPHSVETIGNTILNNTPNIERIIISSGDEFIDSDYRKAIIDKLDKSKTLIDLPYNFDETGTWIESETTAKITKPVLEEIIPSEEVKSNNASSIGFTLSIGAPYKEDGITILKDGIKSDLPELIDGKYHFTKNGRYNITIKTMAGSTSNISFIIGSGQELDYIEAESAIEKAEELSTEEALAYARRIVNSLPEGPLKEEYQARLNAIFVDVGKLKPENITSNLDIYIKSENMLSLSIDTNSVTFDSFSGIEDLEQLNAVNLTINSSLPYKVSASLEGEIKNSDNSNTINKDILNIRANGETNYNTFDNTQTPVTLLDDQQSGKDKTHGIDIKLKSSDSFERDIYKTTIKFEVEQK